MPLYDYECYNCENIEERIEKPDGPQEIICGKCSGTMRRIISTRTPFDNLIDSPWLASVLEVVDKNPKKAHCQAFLKNPTRKNYQNWMKNEGIRPIDPGEKYLPKKTDTGKGSLFRQKMLERFQQRNRIEITR